MNRKRKPSEAAARSGFPTKFRAWMAHNRETYESGGGILGPRNARQVALAIQALGVDCSPGAATGWKKGLSLPDADAIGQLEVLMSVPWALLHDPAVSWKQVLPIRPFFAAFFRGESAEGGVEGRLRSALGQPSRGRP